MTTLEACSKLHEWFVNNDVFNLEEDFKNFLIIEEDRNKTMAAFNSALEEFQKANILVKTEIEKKVYWVLKRPFNSLEQTIIITASVAAAISTLINGFCVSADNKDNLCNPLEIKEKDIVALLYLGEQTLNAELKKKKKLED